MKPSIFVRLAGAAALAGLAAGCQTEPQTIPVMTMATVMQLPSAQRPTIFRDPTTNEVHRTDGLSRNPNDCVRWGCIGVRSL